MHTNKGKLKSGNTIKDRTRTSDINSYHLTMIYTIYNIKDLTLKILLQHNSTNDIALHALYTKIPSQRHKTIHVIRYVNKQKNDCQKFHKRRQ